MAGMEKDQPKHSLWTMILAGAVALAIAYGGGYYMLVERSRGIDFDFITGKTVVAPHYAGFAPATQWRLERFFAPIHSLDRRIRPHVWEPMP